VVLDDFLKHGAVIAACIQALGVMFASYFIPKFLEKRRHDNDRMDKVILKKEEALGKFLRSINCILLNQRSYKVYYKKGYDCGGGGYERTKEDIDKYKGMADEFFKRYIFMEEPYEVACILAQLEFPELSGEIGRFQTAIDEYIKEPCGECDNQYDLLFEWYGRLAKRMTKLLAELRADR